MRFSSYDNRLYTFQLCTRSISKNKSEKITLTNIKKKSFTAHGEYVNRTVQRPMKVGKEKGQNMAIGTIQPSLRSSCFLANMVDRIQFHTQIRWL